jgi:hypothetical protein
MTCLIPHELGRFRFSRAQSNVQSLWRFYNIHDVSSTVLASPFLNDVGTPIKQGDASVRTQEGCKPLVLHMEFLFQARDVGSGYIEIIQHQNIQWIN